MTARGFFLPVVASFQLAEILRQVGNLPPHLCSRIVLPDMAFPFLLFPFSFLLSLLLLSSLKSKEPANRCYLDMTETQELLGKITALRQRLAQVRDRAR